MQNDQLQISASSNNISNREESFQYDYHTVSNELTAAVLAGDVCSAQNLLALHSSLDVAHALLLAARMADVLMCETLLTNRPCDVFDAARVAVSFHHADVLSLLLKYGCQAAQLARLIS